MIARAHSVDSCRAITPRTRFFLNNAVQDNYSGKSRQCIQDSIQEKSGYPEYTREIFLNTQFIILNKQKKCLFRKIS